MCGEINSGNCKVCGKPAESLERTYFHYPHIKCECCNKSHFMFIEHHTGCTPKEPIYQKVSFKTSDLKNPIIIALNIVRSIFEDKSKESYYSTQVETLSRYIMEQYQDSDNNYDKATTAAKNFLDNL